MPEEKESPTFISFINWGFQALLVALLAWGVTELSGVNKSVQELNVKMAVVMERDITRGEQVQEIKERLKHLEGK